MMKRRFDKRRERPVARNCQFCDNKTLPDYKEVMVLNKYLTERGKIMGRARTGLCSKHQRELERQIKHARHVALLPFVARA